MQVTEALALKICSTFLKVPMPIPLLVMTMAPAPMMGLPHHLVLGVPGRSCQAQGKVRRLTTRRCHRRWSRWSRHRRSLRRSYHRWAQGSCHRWAQGSCHRRRSCRQQAEAGGEGEEVGVVVVQHGLHTTPSRSHIGMLTVKQGTSRSTFIPLR